MGVPVHDVRCFDQVSHLEKFMESHLHNEGFRSTNLLEQKKCTEYFEDSKNGNCHSELLSISQLLTNITHDAKVEWGFSLMQTLWTKESNVSNVELLRVLSFLQCNLKGFSCTCFHTFLKSNMFLLNKIWSMGKYEWARVMEEDWITSDKLHIVCIGYTNLNKCCF